MTIIYLKPHTMYSILVGCGGDWQGWKEASEKNRYRTRAGYNRTCEFLMRTLGDKIFSFSYPSSCQTA